MFLQAKYGICNEKGRNASVTAETKRMVASDETPLCDLIRPLVGGLTEFCTWPSREAMLQDLKQLALSFERLYLSEESEEKAGGT
jgi:hypothetical protein